MEDFFREHGHGNIVEVKLMNGFGFIQYDNEDDPKDIVPGRDFKSSNTPEYEVFILANYLLCAFLSLS